MRLMGRTLLLAALSVVASIGVTLLLEYLFVRPFFPGMNLYIGAGIAAGVSALLATPTIYVFLRLQARLAALYARVERLAMTDDLTGLMNRRSFLAEGERRHVAGGVPATVVLIDLDRFKTVNDRYGHAGGDAVLEQAAAAIAAVAGAHRLVARLGGEEFVVLGPCEGEEAAEILAEAIRRAIGERPVLWNGEAIGVTASIGVARLSAGVTLGAALSFADEALYRAKRAGRDRVVAFRPEMVFDDLKAWQADEVRRDGVVVPIDPAARPLSA